MYVLLAADLALSATVTDSCWDRNVPKRCVGLFSVTFPALVMQKFLALPSCCFVVVVSRAAGPKMLLVFGQTSSSCKGSLSECSVHRAPLHKEVGNLTDTT